MSSNNAVLFLRAQTSVHPGAGASVGAIDLPVQRERHTQWPNVQGSAVKGVLREAYRMHLIRNRQQSGVSDRAAADRHGEVAGIFGADVNAGDHGGTLAVTDARILAFPVRSAKGVFAWVTCPRVLARVSDDMKMADLKLAAGSVGGPSDDQAGVTDAGVANLFLKVGGQSRLVLEDMMFERAEDVTDMASDGAKLLKAAGASDADKRIVILSDDAFTHVARYCTEIATRIALEFDTKRVKDGALFVLELLPPETILYSLLLVGAQRGGTVPPEQIAGKIRDALGSPGLLQIGGEETTGKGWCWANIYPETQP